MAQNAALQQRRSRPNIVLRQPRGPGFLSRGHCGSVEVPRQRQGNLTAQKLHAETQVLNGHVCDHLSEDQVPVSAQGCFLLDYGN